MSKNTSHLLPPWAKSLSARLLLLTVGFVMLAEVLIYAPSIGRFRLAYLEERLATAHLAILALETTPGQMINEALERELLDHVGAFSIALRRPDVGKLLLSQERPPDVDATYDLSEGRFFGLIRDSFVTLSGDGSRVLRVLGPSPKNPDVLVEITLSEAALRAEMAAFSWRILGLSLLISLFTAALVYLSLHWLMVRPLSRLAAAMAHFREKPEDAGRVMKPSERNDEIGLAQRELASLQEGVRAALGQKNRLAALGSAVTKINHDLRNILATASLLGERLSQSDAPEVRHTAPNLIGAIDRAIDLCEQTLHFSREGLPKLEISALSLADLVRDLEASLPEVQDRKITLINRIGSGVLLDGDRNQLYRVLLNLAENALQAGATQISIEAQHEKDQVLIDFRDDGPGMTERAKANLFQPFAGSTKPGGSGLGLAIAREILRGHGGDIRLMASSSEGTAFRLNLPLHQAPYRALT